MATKQITVGNEGRYNFHNVADLVLRVRPEQYVRTRDIVTAVELTPSQCSRIMRHFCGISDCCCGSRPAGMDEIRQGVWVIHLTREQAEHLTDTEIDRDDWTAAMY